MAHDASKVALGSTRSSVKDVTVFEVSPSSFQAGLAVSLNSSGSPSLLASAGMRIGVSLGKSLTDANFTDVARTGLKVPMLAHKKRATGTITITAFGDLLSGGADTIEVGETTFTASASAVTPGDATFRAATDNATTAASLAAQINAHATAGALVYAVASSAVVTLYSIVDGVGSTGTGNDIDLVYNNLHGSAGATVSGAKLSGGLDTVAGIDYDTVGTKVYINNTTGKADANISGFTTISDAIYQSNALTGIAEDLSEVPCVLVDMQGGL